MIQLVFAASTPAEALTREPETVGYSSHEGTERATWGEAKLELVDGTHPVVYPAAGSHANKYTAALYMGRSTRTGVGCDDTRGPHTELRPVVKTIPGDADAARRAFPWITFEGRWGELQPTFFNGPTGPNLKSQWTRPIETSDRWQSRSYGVPASGVLGTGATDFFCQGVTTGSKALVQLLRAPWPTLVVLAGLLLLVLYAGSRTTWRPSAPLRLARRRSAGQILASAGRMYVGRRWLFLTIGVMFLPLGILLSLLESVILGGFGLLGIDTTGDAAGALALFVITLGTTLTLLAIVLVQAATACALVEIDQGRPTGPIQAYRLALAKLRPLVGGLAIAVAICGSLAVTGFLLPVAIWLAVRWTLLAQATVLEDRSAVGGLRRSARLVSGRWLRLALVVGIGGTLVVAAGPLLGALLVLATDAPLPLLNSVAAIVYALAMPYVALTTTYLYVDARIRLELEPPDPRTTLPAEIDPLPGISPAPGDPAADDRSGDANRGQESAVH
jgi:hypothetical protein